MSDLVKNGYNEISKKYAAQRDLFPNQDYLEHFVSKIIPGSTVLDVGCGSGIPIDEYLLHKGFAVNGIDISEKQITLARRNISQGLYELKDMTKLQDYEYCVGGIVSFYAIFHTPRETHGELFKKFATFMPSGGALLVTMGAGENPGAAEDFHGVPMFYSFYPPEKNAQLIEGAGFTILVNEIDKTNNERHQVILATI